MSITKFFSFLFVLASAVIDITLAIVDVQAFFQGDVEIVNLLFRILLSSIAVGVLFGLGQIIFYFSDDSGDGYLDMIFNGGGLVFAVCSSTTLHIIFALIKIAVDFLNFLGSIFH